ncbi:MAG TPA: glycoside hydrolase family 16 protein [Mycobacteriales bacterium]|nr:glycoside hydrolase family 16 protein [Mycobacteriales bacterium]
MSRFAHLRAPWLRDGWVRWVVVALAFTALAAPAVLPTARSGAEPAGPQLVSSVVVDPFNGPANSLPNTSIWELQTGSGVWGNGEVQNYTDTAANASLDGHGHLLLTARRTGTAGHYAYTSGRLASWAAVGPSLHAEARIKMAGGYGLWPTFWLIGGNPNGAGWPVTGELDVAESIGRIPTSLYATAHGFQPDPTAKPPFHWQSASIKHMSKPLSAGYHTYALDVTTNTVTWSVDHHVYKVLHRSDLPTTDVWSFNVPFHVILSLAVGGWFAGEPKTTTHFPVSMVVDYVSVTSTS